MTLHDDRSGLDFFVSFCFVLFELTTGCSFERKLSKEEEEKKKIITGGRVSCVAIGARFSIEYSCLFIHPSIIYHIQVLNVLDPRDMAETH